MACFPMWYLLVSKMSSSNPGAVTSSAFFTFYQITQGAYLLTSLVFGLIGLIAVILARRMVTRALRQGG